MNGNVCVFVEQRDGVLQKVGFELLGEATKLAKEINSKVVAILIGHNVKGLTSELIAYGANEVIVVEDEMLKDYVTEPYAKALTNVIKETKPEIVLIGATSIGRDLAPRVSARVQTGLTADCTQLAIDEETKNLLMTRPAFGGNIMATIVCENHRPQMATVRGGVMKALDKDTAKTGTVSDFKVDFVAADMNVKIRETIMSTSKKADITEQKVLVSGGRGIGNADNFKKLADLASVLKGEVASSRSMVDAGVTQRDVQVGQTGKTVRPELYFALGISGAIQHVVGMEGSELIIAVNKDKYAPIFETADLGIVGDANVIVPKLTEALKKEM